VGALDFVKILGVTPSWQNL